MNASIALNEKIRIGKRRLSLYYGRTINSMETGNRPQALADLAELHYIAIQLWKDLENLGKVPVTPSDPRAIRQIADDLEDFGHEVI
jgi:hypothetical protein